MLRDPLFRYGWCLREDGWKLEMEVVSVPKRLIHCLRDKLPLPYDGVAPQAVPLMIRLDREVLRPTLCFARSAICTTQNI